MDLRRRLKQPVEQIPDKEAGELSDKEKEDGPAGAGLVEAEGYGDHVADERNPCCEGEPDTIFVYARLLLLEGFRLYIEPFLDPFPFADPSDPECEYAAEPVAERTYGKTADGIVGCRENCKV